MKPALIILALVVAELVGGLVAYNAQNPDVLPAAKALEIAKAQRDYVIAKGTFERSAQALQSLTQEANDLCKKAGMGYDGDKISCIALSADKPATVEK